jgi:hypothetical protein
MNTPPIMMDGKPTTLFDWANSNIPSDLVPHLDQPDGPAFFVEYLPTQYPPKSIVTPGGTGQIAWQNVGTYYRITNRPFEALQIYNALYIQMLNAQFISQKWIHKGMPLVWMHECYKIMQYPATAQRYLMLTLCEDAIRDKGKISPNGGVYYRFVGSGLPESELRRYVQDVYTKSIEHPEESRYPEWILQEIDQQWMTENPSPQEGAYYKANVLYIKLLQTQLGKSSGKGLERLAQYLLSCMPGCRTSRRENTPSTDYDVVCSIEGFETDFRSELGRYFICECKDLNESASFSDYAKFCTVLQSINSRFGILFSKNNISGKGKGIDADRQELKIYQSLKIVIIVIDKDDIEFIAQGGNFINLLRRKYEIVRLDLSSSYLMRE